MTILGLGLMGGSLALALRDLAGGLQGVDPDPEARRLAAELGIFSDLAASPEELLRPGNVVVLAAPVRASLEVLESLPGWHPGPALVMDICSTKDEISRALEGLPAAFTAVGAHPMCGKELSGITHASPDLYRGAPFVFTPLSNTSAAARIWAEQLAKALGSILVWMEAADHDRLVASISHVPYLLACALAAISPEQAAPLASSGYRSTARLAASPPEMMMDVLATNTGQVREALAALIAALQQAEQHLDRFDLPALRDWLEGARARHLALLAKSSEGIALEADHQSWRSAAG